MKRTDLHLNLLREDEKYSSSPVRLRVMAPVLATILCAALALWWGFVFAQLQLARGRVRQLRANLDACKAAHAGAVEDIVGARELQGELDQLAFYVNGRRTYGGLLAKLAETVPEHVQFTSLVIPEPKPQQLKNPLTPKVPALLGPTNVTEQVVVRITGRTPKAAPVTAFMETLAGEDFAPWLVVGETEAGASPKIHSFSQEATGNASEGRLLSFDVEYRAVERRFAK